MRTACTRATPRVPGEISRGRAPRTWLTGAARRGAWQWSEEARTALYVLTAQEPEGACRKTFRERVR